MLTEMTSRRPSVGPFGENLVGSALANFPLASVILSGTITTILLAVIFWKLRRDRRPAEGAAPAR
jgi:hypothetical protein